MRASHRRDRQAFPTSGETGRLAPRPLEKKVDNFLPSRPGSCIVFFRTSNKLRLRFRREPRGKAILQIRFGSSASTIRADLKPSARFRRRGRRMTRKWRRKPLKSLKTDSGETRARSRRSETRSGAVRITPAARRFRRGASPSATAGGSADSAPRASGMTRCGRRENGGTPA
jgi:hypothetical protein